jgi:hypothetical protein
VFEMVDTLVAQLPGDLNSAAALSRMRLMKMQAINAFEAQAKHLVSEHGLPSPSEAKAVAAIESLHVLSQLSRGTAKRSPSHAKRKLAQGIHLMQLRAHARIERVSAARTRAGEVRASISVPRVQAT